MSSKRIPGRRFICAADRFGASPPPTWNSSTIEIVRRDAVMRFTRRFERARMRCAKILRSPRNLRGAARA